MTPEYLRVIRNNTIEGLLLHKETSLAVPLSDTLALTAEVDRLKAENAQLHAELRHYRDGRPRLDRSVQP